MNYIKKISDKFGNREEFRKVHFVGIGGAGLSAMARILYEMGYDVSGSDIKESNNTKRLWKFGMDVKIGHDSKNVIGKDVLVISTAISEDNCEVIAAKELGINVYSRAKMLEWISSHFRTIAISGTHGKTTTTSMIALLLEWSDLDPTIIVGGELNDIGSNAKYGKGEYCVVEADESDGTFLQIKPEIAVVTNVEDDHLDYYKSKEKIDKAFRQYINSVSANGLAIINGDDPSILSMIDKIDRRYITYGLKEGNDVRAIDIKIDGFKSKFEAKLDGEQFPIKLKVPGEHNIYNALATISVGKYLGIPAEKISFTLSQFVGAQRRFDVIDSPDKVTIIDDYAHHPTEISATLRAANNKKHNRLISVFQPHRYTRTNLLHDKFGNSFDYADLCLITKIYSAGEEPIPGVTSKLIVDSIIRRNYRKQIIYLPQKKNIINYLIKNVETDDIVVVMGAGDIYTVAYDLLKKLQV